MKVSVLRTPVENLIHPNHQKDRKNREKQREIERASLKRKRLRYWRDTILNDSAISWSWNLTILKKKLEYNIGYWKYVQRHIGWYEDVKRMELCCKLLEIASEDYPNMTGIYVNANNAAKYGMTILNDDFLEFHLKDLRKEKAYRILWQYLDHNMKKMVGLKIIFHPVSLFDTPWGNFAM